jgi:5-methylcytosine-specific restriction enzyme subunit McrC
VRRRFTLVAGKYIGLIPINSRILIDVRPKIRIDDLFRVLNVANEQLGALTFFERGYRQIEGPDENILHLLIRTLVKQLQSLEAEGLHKTYKQIVKTGPFRPRINFARTVQRNWSRGIFSTTTCEVFEFSRDNPLNRLVKYALWYSGTFLSLRTGEAELKEQLRFFLEMFETVPLDRSLGFVPAVKLLLASGQIPALRHYYEALARTCLAITGNSSVSLEVQGADVSLLSFVLNFEEVFEKYVRNTLKNASTAHVPPLQILDGNKEGRGYLFTDSRTYEVRPDIVIKKAGAPRVILDVKYKPKISESDRYQIISHAFSMGARTAVLVLPRLEEGKPAGLIRRGKIREGLVSVELFEYHFPLDSDLPTEEGRFAVQVLEMADAP